MGTVTLSLVAIMVLVLVIRSLCLVSRPRVEVARLGDRISVILYYASRDGNVRKVVLACWGEDELNGDRQGKE